MNLKKLAQAMGDLDEREVNAIVQEIVDDGGNDVYEALEAFQKGMEIIGERFDSCEYFIGDLIFAGELMTHAVNILRPALQDKQPGKAATRDVIICTVEGDLHDIGKNIVKTVLEGRGINVIDLGVNASPGVIVERAILQNIRVIALSGVLTYSRETMKLTVDAFVNAGIRDEVKIIVGGSCVNENNYKKIGADAWAASPKDSADICCQWLK